jgi:hypothetical protein
MFLVHESINYAFSVVSINTCMEYKSRAINYETKPWQLIVVDTGLFSAELEDIKLEIYLKCFLSCPRLI